MSKNINYSNEIATAHRFILDHNQDTNLLNFLSYMEKLAITHNDRWDMVYNFMQENYPDTPASLITGITLYLED